MNLEQDRSAAVEREIRTSPDIEQVRFSELAVAQVRCKRIGIPLAWSRNQPLLVSKRQVRRKKRCPGIRISIRRTKSVDEGTFEHPTRILGHAMQMEKAGP